VRNLQIITDAAEMTEVVNGWKSAGDSVGLVPTMGFLHQGHRALMDHAATRVDRVVVSIFVNPLQFSAGEDFERYPRDSEADLDFLRGAAVDAVFMPEAQEIYPLGIDHTPRREAGAVGAVLEGAHRPGHFDGVVTVVHRLFSVVGPDVAVFGRKDAQQVFLVRSMVASEALAVEIDEVDTVRDGDGLALSSRNSYLTPEQRETALCIPRALTLAAEQSTLRGALDVATRALEAQPGITLDYVAAVDPATFMPVEASVRQGDVVLLVALEVGATRLIDNRALTFSSVG
jgi:pantoate--beta-alanine ligase